MHYIAECFRGIGLIIKCCINSSVYFTFGLMSIEKGCITVMWIVNNGVRCALML